MMNTISQIFERGKVLIPYVTAGDPDLETTAEIICSIDKAGADIIEVGIPFSDPQADGPVIQAAGQRALKKGASLKSILKMVGDLKGKVRAPLLLMGYYNPVLHYGKEAFIKDARQAGVSGVIIPDLPFDEDEEFYKELEKNNMTGILMVSPNSREDRLADIGKKCSGFVYCVSLLGITGDSRGPVSGLEEYIGRVRKHIGVPLALGFGIDSPEKAAKAALYADGVVVGSAIVKLVEQYSGTDRLLPEVSSFVSSLKKAIA
jgi:tryptophan synthase alpha chain